MGTDEVYLSIGVGGLMWLANLCCSLPESQPGAVKAKTLFLACCQLYQAEKSSLFGVLGCMRFVKLIMQALNLRFNGI
jgi:hypothetical protein